MKLIPQKLEGWSYCMVKITFLTSTVLTNPPVYQTGNRTLRTQDLSDLKKWVRSVSGHFGPGSEVSRVRNVLGPKCPVSVRQRDRRTIAYSALSICCRALKMYHLQLIFNNILIILFTCSYGIVCFPF